MSNELSLTNRNILNVALPIMAGGFVQFLVNFVNTYFVDKLGEMPLNAVGNGGLIYITLFVAGQGFSTSLQVIVARRKGQGKNRQIGMIFDHALVMMGVISVLLLIGGWCFSQFLMPSLVKDAEILRGMQEFLRYRFWGFLFSIFEVGIIGYYTGTAQTRVITYSTMLIAGLNIFLDYSLIYGRLGFPEMGIAGAGVASVIAEAAALVFVLVYLYFDKQTKQYGLFRFIGFKAKVFLKLLKLAYPLVAQRFVSLFAWTAFFLMIEKAGPRELAVSQIVRNLYFLAFIPIFGFGTAAGTFVSHYMSKKDPANVIRSIKRIGIISALFTLLFVHGYLLYPAAIIDLLTNQDYLITETIPILRLIVSSMLIHSFVMVLFSAVAGVGDTRWSFVIETSSIVLYLAYCYYVCIVNKQSLMVIWSAEFIYFGLLALFSLAYFRFSNWKNYNL
ncbi:MAG: MATE family efflux transporter [Bacteroidota bacterium]